MFKEIKNTTLSFLILLLLTCLLNVNTKLVICSGIYVSLMLMILLLTEIYSKKEVLFILVICILPNIILLDNTPVDTMIIGSFFSLIVSVYFGINLSRYLRYRVTFPIQILIALISSSFIDSTLIGLSLITKYSVTKAMSIGVYDFGLKAFYSTAVFLMIYGMRYVKNTYLLYVEKHK